MTARRDQLTGELLERELLVVAVFVLWAADDGVVAIGHVGGIALPDLGGALFHLAADVHRGLVGGPAASEGGAAAAGDLRVADRVGVDHVRMHVLGGDAERLGELHRKRGASAADVGRAEHQRNGAVAVDLRVGGGLEADVEPEALGHAASAIGSFQLRLPVRRFLRGGHALDVADHAVGETVGALRALFAGVLEAHLERVDAQLFGELVQHRLGSELRLRRAGRAVGGGLRLVDDHVVAVDQLVGNVVGSQRAHRARADRRAGVGARLKCQVHIGRRDRAVALRAHADAHVGARGRAGREQHFLAVHSQLDRSSGLLREQRGQRLEVDGNLAAEAAADLHRRDLDLRGGELQQRRDRVAHDERALGRGPDVERAVGAVVGGAVVRLDVALVRH